VAVGADAPDVHGEDLAVLVEGDGDDSLFPALGAEDFDTVRVVLDRAAVWLRCRWCLRAERRRWFRGNIRGAFAGRGADPVGNAVRFGRKGRCNGGGR